MLFDIFLCLEKTALMWYLRTAQVMRCSPCFRCLWEWLRLAKCARISSLYALNSGRIVSRAARGPPTFEMSPSRRSMIPSIALYLKGVPRKRPIEKICLHARSSLHPSTNWQKTDAFDGFNQYIEFQIKHSLNQTHLTSQIVLDMKKARDYRCARFPHRLEPWHLL